MTNVFTNALLLFTSRSDSETPVNFNISQNYGSFDMRQETIA